MGVGFVVVRDPLMVYLLTTPVIIDGTLLMNTSTDRRTLIALAVALVFWSSAFAAIRAALVAYGPGELALLRFLTASAVLGAYAIASRMHLPKLRDLPLIALLGLLVLPAITFR